MISGCSRILSSGEPDSTNICNMCVISHWCCPRPVTCVSDSGISLSPPLRAPGFIQGLPIEELTKVEFSSQYVSILDAEMSTVPKPPTAVNTNVAFNTWKSANCGNRDRLNDTIALEVEVFVFKIELLPMNKLSPVFGELGLP